MTQAVCFFFPCPLPPPFPFVSVLTSLQKLLRTLGYMSDFARAPDVDERIQMHADKMYREEEEAAAAAAAAASSSGFGSDSDSPP